MVSDEFEPMTDVLPLTVRIPEDISSDRYPLSMRWLKGAILKQVIIAFFFSAGCVAVMAYNLQHTILGMLSSMGLLALVCGTSLVSLLRIVLLVRWRAQYDFRFTEDGVVGRSVRSYERLPDGTPILPYGELENCELTRDILDRIFGCAALSLNRPGGQTTQFTQPLGRPSLVIRGLSLDDARHIEDMVQRYVLPRSLARSSVMYE